jgi:hypothetical protein
MSENKLNIIEIKSIRNPEKTGNPEKSGKTSKIRNFSGRSGNSGDDTIYFCSKLLQK